MYELCTSIIPRQDVWGPVQRFVQWGSPFALRWKLDIPPVAANDGSKSGQERRCGKIVRVAFVYSLRARPAAWGSCSTDHTTIHCQMPHNGGFREIDGIALGEHTLCLTPFTHGHFIDHGALQFAPVAVGNGCTLNAGATVMPLSLVRPSYAICGNASLRGWMSSGSPVANAQAGCAADGRWPMGRHCSPTRGSVAEMRRHTAAQVVDAKMAQVEVTVPAEYLHRLEEHCRRPSGPAVGDASTR
eukprot:scaffold1466_cov385-Prasinococcus_capsulatus_cf.AAC.8